MLRASIIAVALILAVARVALAANPVAYRVSIAPTGNDGLDAALAATSELRTLRGTAPVGPFGLIVRARTDVDRLKTVLDSFGYYESAVRITIDGEPLADPQLPDALARIAKGRDATVAVAFALGPRYHLGRIGFDGEVPPFAREVLGLRTGEPAVAAAVLAGGARVRTALEDHGYAFARVDPPVATLDETHRVLDLAFPVVTGPRVRIGAISIEGLKRVRERYVLARLPLHRGEPYSPPAIERARTALIDVGVFATVSVRVGKAPDAAGGVPVTFVVRERPRHAVSINAAYSSDLGGSGGVTWTDRNVFGHAERLSVSSSITNFGGTATTGLGYDASAKLVKPDFGDRDQSVQFAVNAVKQSLVAYDQTAVTTGATLVRRLSSVWTANVGVTTANELVVQPPRSASPHRYTLIELPIGLEYDSTRLASPLQDPVRGMRDSLTVTPTRSIGTPSATFVITQLKLAGYLDLHRFGWTASGRSVIAVRALAGLAQGAGEFSLPPDQRFYGGGSGTIRGFRYQGVGPVFPHTTTPIGGTAIIAGTLEFRQRFGKNFGAAVFVDAGQVSASLKLLQNVLRVGIGGGLRYYTPIGPIRIDVALPARRYSPSDDPYEIYVGLGQAF
ncbi:MAG: BamA/TamA family outer membrane protein [Gammaproteobacteria bacterium]|nr:BamA/TamA family outer membrane protein [Gammaproteobacteria bacterium]